MFNSNEFCLGLEGAQDSHVPNLVAGLSEKKVKIAPYILRSKVIDVGTGLNFTVVITAKRTEPILFTSLEQFKAVEQSNISSFMEKLKKKEEENMPEIIEKIESPENGNITKSPAIKDRNLRRTFLREKAYEPTSKKKTVWNMQDQAKKLTVKEMILNYWDSINLQMRQGVSDQTIECIVP